jgi:hypothetical protein
VGPNLLKKTAPNRKTIANNIGVFEKTGSVAFFQIYRKNELEARKS